MQLNIYLAQSKQYAQSIAAAEAIARACSSNDGSGEWKFLLVDSVSKAPEQFEDPVFFDGKWDDIKVPGHWQLQDCGRDDLPIYTNTMYPFRNHPPYVPRNNPTGLYRRSFHIPSEWFATEGGVLLGQSWEDPVRGCCHSEWQHAVRGGRTSPAIGCTALG